MDTEAERITALEVRTDYQQDSINKLIRIQEELTKSVNELVISSKNQTESIKEISLICKETTDKMNDIAQNVSVLEEKQNHVASELFTNIFSKLNWKNVSVSIIIILLVLGQILGWNVKDTIEILLMK